MDRGGGRTYKWMCEEYLREYNLQVSPSMFSNLRARRGLGRRSARDDELIPWHVDSQLRWRYPLAMLRYEARRRAGMDLEPPKRLAALTAWISHLREGVVVYYDRDTENGFLHVPARLDIDTDLIRVPERKTTGRRSTG